MKPRTSWYSPIAGALLGAFAAIIGLLPWLLTGVRLPLQNLWRTEVLPAEMPRALLPLSQYQVTTVVAMLTAGGVAAGLLARRLHRSGQPPWAVIGGLVVAQAIAIAQSFATLRKGLGLPSPADSRATNYWWALLAGVLVVWAVVALGTWLLSRIPRGSVALGLVLAAVPLGSWVGAWLTTLAGPTGPPSLSGELTRWIPGVVVALALTWCGLATLQRGMVWLVGFVALAVFPPVVTATTSVLGARALLGDPKEMVAMMVAVLRAAAGAGLITAFAALALAAVGLSRRR